MNRAPYTTADLVRQLRALGVQPGGTLFVHASYKSLGPLADGVATILAALEQAVDTEGGGLLLMPAFNLIKGDRTANWDPATTPATTGYLSEAVRTRPGTLRSDCPVHSVCAAGRDAAAVVAEHRARSGWRSPWDTPAYGYDFGDGAPLVRAYRRPGSQLLMLGTDYMSVTYCHLVEVMLWNGRLAAAPDAAYVWLSRPPLGDYWESLGRLRRGPLGDADCRLFAIADFVDSLLQACVETPDLLGAFNAARLRGESA